MLSLADAEVELSGRIGTIPTMEGTDLALRASGEAFLTIVATRRRVSCAEQTIQHGGNIRLADGTLALSSLQLQIDDTQLTGNAELALDAILDHGSFSLEATSPDLFVLLPNLAEITVPEVAPLALRASGEWAENVWSLSEFDMQLADGSLQAAVPWTAHRISTGPISGSTRPYPASVNQRSGRLRAPGRAGPPHLSAHRHPRRDVDRRLRRRVWR